METQDKIAEVKRFRDRLLKEDMERAHKRQVRSAWCTELYEASDGEVSLPYSINYGSEYITKYHPYPKDDDGNDDYSVGQEVDVEATNRIIAIIVQFARSKGYDVEYKHTDEEFFTTITIDKDEEDSYNNVTVDYRANRSSVCTRIKKTVHVEEKVIEAHDEEVTEWDCRKVSFLAMDTELQQ
jgi:hypothetical protein